jgi:hypothetical protein
MKTKDLKSRAAACAVLTTAAIATIGGLPRAHAAERAVLPHSFSGLLNDYTPAAPTVSGGPYEMHGRWSLQLSDSAATFSADMTMETSDFANTDPNHDPTQLSPHTHHISMTGGAIHNDPTDPINWTTSCPTLKPAATGGFVVTGTAYVTGNGGNPPFGNPSAITICILGGSQNSSITGPQAFVEFSNFTLAFGSSSPASSHFGTQAINGVINRCESLRTQASSDCTVSIVD